MARTEGLIHRKLPPDAVVHTRQPVPAETTDKQVEAPGYEAIGAAELRDQLRNIARAADNRSNPVDEYNTAAISGAGSSTAVTVQPTYEYMPEKIESIIVTGPAGNITLRLGDRIWNLVIPASQILTVGPAGLLLSRTDDRVLTAQTPGTYTLELMGVADRRFGM